MPVIELRPFTDAQREALRACRFVTPNRARTHAWALTTDKQVAATLGAATAYRRCSEPELYEYEVTLTHPDAVALACDIADGRNV